MTKSRHILAIIILSLLCHYVMNIFVLTYQLNKIRPYVRYLAEKEINLNDVGKPIQHFRQHYSCQAAAFL